MVKYYFQNETFVIEDFQNAKTFASFLPAVAGEKGKPVWAFYANVGQAMGGFGVDNKDTPITPFDSANLAYQNIALKSFRTFIKINGKLYSPFLYPHSSQRMYVNKSDITIEEERDGYKISITYSSVPSKSYAGLIRKVIVTNMLDEKCDFEIVDGLPIFFPHGLSNFAYKELVSLMAAYCQITNIDHKAPFVKFKTSTADNSVVALAVDGNGFVTIDENNNRLDNIVDLTFVFKDDYSLMSPKNLLEKNFAELKKEEQQTENKLPCAFSYTSKPLKSKESYTFYSLFGTFNDVESFNNAVDALCVKEFEQMIEDSKKLIVDLLKPMDVHTSNKLFDMYLDQTLLDNNLRGGFPVKLNNGKDGETYYIYSRKHGDMERDYNSFQIPSKYYSSGCGNFRDVNQNRRSDLYLYPFVKDYNIRLFFSLIQADGQNPLNVKPLKFVKNDDFDSDLIKDIGVTFKDKIMKLLEGYEPSELYTLLKDNESELNIDADQLFKKLLGCSHQSIEANFAEGYWVDHWTYNVDLLENFISVYPDKEEELLFDHSYRYFYSPVFVEPRKEKHVVLPDGRVRQYGAIDLASIKKYCDRNHIDLNKTDWLKDKNGNIVTASLLAKIMNLITVKFSTLDSYGIGLEMECEKPGWNDAMNGLPGIFASGTSETVELLRLVKFALRTFTHYEDRNVDILKEQKEFIFALFNLLNDLLANKLTQFDYWDNATSLRETYRETIRYNASGEFEKVPVKDFVEVLKAMEIVLDKALEKGKDVNDGILPTYIVYEVTDYEKLGRVNHLGFETVKVKGFKMVNLPVFLEASARGLKLGKKYVTNETISKIKASDVYDKTLHMYKTCADIEDAPFEIGRVHAFTKGWLERECNFLHMTYKYLLGLLKAGYYEEFFAEAKNNLVYNLDPYVYGRSPIENSSFIVPTCNPDKKNHGRGFFARLTGANAEFLNMWSELFFGNNLFLYENEKLVLNLNPKLPASFFDEKDEVSFKLFNSIKITYHNPLKLNLFDGVQMKYLINGTWYEKVEGKLAEDIRNGLIESMYVEIVK